MTSHVEEWAVVTAICQELQEHSSCLVSDVEHTASHMHKQLHHHACLVICLDKAAYDTGSQVVAKPLGDDIYLNVAAVGRHSRGGKRPLAWCPT